MVAVVERIVGLIKPLLGQGHECVNEQRLRDVENKLGQGDKVFGFLEDAIKELKETQKTALFWVIGAMGTAIITLIVTLINIIAKK